MVRRNLGLPHRLISKNFNCVIWVQDTTFTVSNTGMFGSESGTPIISRPQLAVLALGNILRRAWIIEENGEEKILPQSVMTLSLSYDHRIVDGALASKFLTEIKKNMERY